MSDNDYTNQPNQPNQPTDGFMVNIDELTFFDYAMKQFKDLAGADYDNTKEDMATNGQRNPILIDQNKMVIDGRQRVRIAQDLGWGQIKATMKSYDTDDQRQEDADKTNILRRHMTKEQRLVIVAKYYAPRLMKRQQSVKETRQQVAQHAMHIRENKEGIKPSEPSVSPTTITASEFHSLVMPSPSPSVTPELTQDQGQPDQPGQQNTPVVFEHQPHRRISDDIKETASEMGLEISSYEAHIITKAIALAKSSDMSITDAIEQIREKKREQDREFQRDLKSEASLGSLLKADSLVHVETRRKIFSLLRTHIYFCAEVDSDESWLHDDIRAKIKPKQPVYIIQL